MSQHDSTQDAEARVEAMNAELDSVLDDGNEVAVYKEPPAPVDQGADRLIQIALERDADVDKLERLIELRNKEIARQAKAVYEDRFAEMQRAFGKITRTREAKDGSGQTMYAFAPLEDIVAVVGPTIADHGFRYRFEEERIEGVDEKRIWCIVTGYGHEERTFVDVPIPPPSKMTNAIQQRGSASSYGKRYAFLAAFGLTLSDEDDDARACSVAEVDDLIPGLAQMEAATTLDELKEAYKATFKAAATESQKMIVIAAKNRRKGALDARE